MRKLSLLASLLLSACMVGPDYAMPSFELPSSWTDKAPSEGEMATTKWWEDFNDPALNALEEEGLTANADIALAAARVAEARAILRLTDADLYPTLSAQAGARRTGPSDQSRQGAFGGSKPYNDFSVAAVLDYEIDLWGKLRRGSESAQAQLLSEKANRDAVRLAVASDIATNYFNLRALDSQLAITRDTITSRQNGFDYQKKQYDAGAIDVLSFRRAEAELAAAEATLPMLEQARVEQQNALSVLLGRSPKAIVEAPLAKQEHIANLPVPPTLPANAPSTLLQRRPDIAAAEQQLVAANAQIGVAIADYYPNLSLSALLGLASADIDNLMKGSARAWDAGATSVLPVLDFGRTGGNVDAAKARTEQALVNYQQVVRLAFADVSNALNRLETTQAQLDAQTRKVKANEETFRVAGLRYDAGYATQLDQLDAQRQLFQAQLNQISAMQERLSAVVTLQKAIGGGWNVPEDAPTTAPAEAEVPAPAPEISKAPESIEAPKAEEKPAVVPFGKPTPRPRR